jgi:hypothetical protein
MPETIEWSDVHDPTDFRPINGHALHSLPAAPTLHQATPAGAVLEPRYVIREATREDVLAFQHCLRPADVAEIRGVGVTVAKALWRGYRNSLRCRVAYVDGDPAAIWGVCVNTHPRQGPLSATAVPWLHTTAAIERQPIAFLREARREVAAMRCLYPRLENHVAANYTQAVRFLRLLGFTVDEPQSIGHNGALFRRFHMGEV